MEACQRHPNRQWRIWKPLAAIVLLTLSLLGPASNAGAAEVLQVRSGRVLQVGDQNRSYSIELACLKPIGESDAEAAQWLRQQLPRRTRVNLRPQGQRDGTMIARVAPLSGPLAGTDLSDQLIAAGLASGLPHCQA